MHKPHGGFTLVEIMVSITLMSILLMLAAPSLTTYRENSKIRAAVESFYASAQLARTEAIRTNQSVQLALTTDEPTAANKNTENLSATASNWIIRTVSDDPTPTYQFLAGNTIREGSGSNSTSSVSVSAMSNGSATPSITFSSASRTLLGAAWQVNFTSTSTACTPSGTARCLRVVITTSGQIKACDPAATTANDTRAC